MVLKMQTKSWIAKKMIIVGIIIWGMVVVLPNSFAEESVSEEAPATEVVSSEESKISLDFKDADIATVLRVMSLKTNINIVAGPEVTGTITIRLEDVAWEKALNVILRTYDYVYERDGNIIRVASRDRMKQEPLETRTFILNYSKANEIKDAVQDILTERGRIKVAERTNMVIVTDIPANLYKIGEVIKKIDKKTVQAFIDSKIVRTELGKSENLGIDWNLAASLTGSSRPTTFPFQQGTEDGSEALSDSIRQFFPTMLSASENSANPADSRAFPVIASEGTAATAAAFTYGRLSFTDFSAVLQMVKSRSNTKIVSNPRITVLNNQTAHIQVGEQIPIPSFERNETTGSMEVTGFSYKDTGVVLNVTPHINSAEEILVDLKPEVVSEGALLQFTSELAAPRFNVTEAETQVLIQSGETIAIGGLLTDNASINEDKVPYLAEIPLIGKLFRSKRQTAGSGNSKIETLFFVTVTMVDSAGQPSGERFEEEEKKQLETNKKLQAESEKSQNSENGETS